MNSNTRTSNRNVRTFIVSLLAYVLLTSQLAPLAMTAKAAANAKANRARMPISVSDKKSGAAEQVSNATQFAPVPKPLPAPTQSPKGAPPVVTIVATKTDNRTAAQPAAPGDTINYTVVISNTGTAAATGVTLTDTIDANTTLVPNSIVSTPLANNDSYNVIGNVRIQPNVAQGLLSNDFNPDTGDATGITASGGTTSTQNGNVVINADGSFSYNPAPGFTGTDTFTYTLTVTATGKTDTGTVTLTVGNGTAAPGTNVVWFIDPAAAAGGDGRLTNPFNCYTGPAASCFSTTAADDPGDSIFLYSGAHTGGNTLLNNQKLIGQGASATLASIAGLTVPTGSDALPATGGASPTITTVIAATVGVPLGQGNTLRGFTVGDVTGTKISGNTFGTLTVGNNTTPDVILNGNGRALGLDTGTIAATSGFASVATTSSTAQGILLTGVGGTVSFGSTSVSGATTQGILTGTTTADINFGNTTVSGGTDGVSFQNNSAGTRTFGTLGVSGGSGNAFIHGAGGGNVTISGAATLSSAGDAISVSAPGATNVINFQAATSATRTAAGGNGVNWAGTAGATMTFSALTIQTNAGTGLNATTGGTINVTNGTGTINNTVQAASAIVANGIALNANFSVINSSGGTNGVSLTNVTGTSNFGGGALSGASGATFNVSGGTASVTYSGDITQANNAAMVFIGGGHTTGTITFQTGTLNASNGTGLQFDNADSTTSYNFNGTTTLNGGDAGIDIFGGSQGTFTFGAGTSINNPSGIAYRESASNANVTYNGTITKNNNTLQAVQINAKSGGTTSFGGQVTASTATGTAIDLLTNTGGTINFRGGLSATTTSGIAFNATGNVTGATVNVCDENPCGASGSNGPLVNTLTTTTGTALNVSGSTTIGANNLEFQSISSNGGTNGIVLNATGAVGGLKVKGSSSGLCGGAVTVQPVGTANTVTAPSTADCTGGTIQNKTGDAISLNNTSNVVLARMWIKNNAGSGVFGDDLTGFSLISSFVDNNSDVADPLEANLRFNELLGTCAITNSTITGAPDDEIRMTAASGTLTNLAISGTVIGNDLAGENGNGLTLSPTSTASVTVNMTNSVVKDVFAAGVVVNGDGTTSRTFNVSNTSFLDMDGVGISMQGSFSADITFNISNNTFLRNVSNAINVSFGTTATNNLDALGTISGNAIGDATVDSGSRDLIGIAMESQGDADTVIFVNNNNIRHSDQQGFFAQSRLDADADAEVGRFDLILRDNTINNIDDNTAFPVFAVNGVHVDGRNTTTLCLDSFSNDSTNVGAIGDFLLRRRDSSNFIIERFDDGDANFNETITSTAVIAAFHNGQSDAGHNTDVLLSGTAPIGMKEAPDNTCRNTPTAGPGLGPVGSSAGDSARLLESQQDDFDPGYVRVVVPDALKGRINLAPPAPRPRNPEPAPETDEITAGALPAEITNGTPAQQPSTDGQMETPKPSTAGQADMPKAFVAAVIDTPKLSTLLPKAAEGGGIDTPKTKSGESKLQAKDGGPKSITPTVANFPITLGTLNPGESVTITFSVTVNNPLPGGTTQVSNQGTVSGSNFANVLTDDPDVAGSANPTVTAIVAAPDITVRDARVAEPTSGTSNMLFTVALSIPAPGPVSVNFATADDTGGGNPATGGTCAGGADYETTSGTVNFVAGQRLQTVAVPICSDATVEPDETLLLNLTSPVGGNISDGQAVGTITAANTPGEAQITEIRTSGPGGTADEFVELYNNSDAPVTVQADDASPGVGLFKMGAACGDTPVLIGTIPNGTVVPARGHYLFVGSTYSLGAYATSNATLTADIENDRNIGFFSTTDVGNLSTETRLDAVGFGTNTGGNCDLLREGTNLQPALGSTAQHSFVRKMTTGLPQDTNDNAADFVIVATDPTVAVGSNPTPILGAPGPENLASPIQRNATVKASLIDTAVASTAPPNRVRDNVAYSDTLTPSAPNGLAPATNPYTLGTLVIRRKFTNNTGGNVTRLRFRIVDITTTNSPGAGLADVRALSSLTGSVATTCCGTVNVLGITLEQPPTQARGGGLNSSMAAGTVTVGTPIANGASVNLNFLLGVASGGTFRFFINVEALP